MIHPVEPDISTKLLSNQHKDAVSDDNENGNKGFEVIRNVPVPAVAVSTRQLSPLKRDMSPATTVSPSIIDQSKKAEYDICDPLVTPVAIVPTRQLSPIRRKLSTVTATSPPIIEERSKADYDVCARGVPVSPDLSVPLSQPVLATPFPVQTVLPVQVVRTIPLSSPVLPIIPVPLTPSELVPYLVQPSKSDLPVMKFPPILPVNPVLPAQKLSNVDTVRAAASISTRPANATPTSTTTKRCASVTAALTAAAAATAATKRLTARNKLICLSSSMDIDDKPPHEFMSLSLSPPLNRRREMPALRGPFVSL